MTHPPIDTRRRQLLAAVAASTSASLARAQGASDVVAPRDTRACIVPIGGALRFDNDVVWSRLVELAGIGARWAVFGTASSHPRKSAMQVCEVLRRHGAAADAIDVAPGDDAAQAVRDPQRIAQVRNAQAVFFCGGAQERIVDTLMPAGADTPLLAAVRDVGLRGGVIAGTSAGAAVMSTTMFRDAQDVLAALKGPLRPGREIDRGLGFVGPSLFVDQHFLRRGRIGRILPMMVKSGYALGLGVDENTAAIVRGDEVEVIGATGALLVDLSEATDAQRGGAFSLRNARISYLDHGDRFDLATRRFTPSPQKRAEPVIDPNAPDFKPFFARSHYCSDILGDTAIVHAMSELMDSPNRESRGLAADLRPIPAGSRPALAFEFRLHKGPDSLAWFTGAFGGEDYSVSNLRLDVTPVRMSRAIHGPWIG